MKLSVKLHKQKHPAVVPPTSDHPLPIHLVINLVSVSLLAIGPLWQFICHPLLSLPLFPTAFENFECFRTGKNNNFILQQFICISLCLLLSSTQVSLTLSQCYRREPRSDSFFS